MRRARKIYASLSGDPNCLDMPNKSRGMHWRTYERLYAKLEAADWQSWAGMALRTHDSKRSGWRVDRQFAAAGPDRLWVADITYIPTWAGFLYLAIVLDVQSRRRRLGDGSTSADRARAKRAEHGLVQRQPQSVIHHSDHGCQYTRYAFGKRCREMGVMSSMGSVGDAYDNAMAESFFATLERELLNGGF